MNKGLTAVATTIMLLSLGGVGFANAQSDAMEETYDANEEPMQPGSGVTSPDHENMDEPMPGSGNSAAQEEASEAMRSETNETTNIQQSEELDEVNAHGQSDAAGEAMEQE